MSKNDERLERTRWLVHLLDTKFEGPLGVRIGLDGLLGLVPVVGDLLTGALSLLVILEAARRGCGPSVLLRMGLNVFLENIVGSVPILGDLFDIYWKANLKNLKLMEAHLSEPRTVTWRSRFLLGILCFVLLGFLVMALALSIRIVRYLIGFIG